MLKRLIQYCSLCLSCALIVFQSNPVQAFDFNLFGDALYRSGNHEGSFELGAVNLNAEQNISDNAYVTLEILFENTHHGFEIDLERFSVTNALTENFEVKMGRYVDPLGFWNQNFYHASLSQDTVSRPFFLELEEQHVGVFPSHLVGAMVKGEYDAWSYQFGVGNSSGIDSTDYATTGTVEMDTINFGDPSTDKTTVLRGTWLALDSLELGLMLMNNKIVEMSEDNGLETTTPKMIKRGDAVFEQKVGGVDYNFTLDNFYTFGEYYQIRFTDNKYIPGANTKDYDAKAYYLHFAYRITDKMTVAYRYENLDFPIKDSTYFSLLGLTPESRHILALKYRIEESHALRFEINRHDPEDMEGATYYSLQWFFFLL